MALEKTRQQEIRRARLDGPVHKPAVDTKPAATTTATAPTTTTTPHVELCDSDKAKLGQSTSKAPVATSPSGNAGNARSLLLQQVQASRADGELSVEQRKLLRTAYKELAKPSAGLDDHLALRSLAREQGVGSAFDEIMRANGERLLPELLDRAQVFEGPGKLRELRELAVAMGTERSFDAHVTSQLSVARSWSKGDDAGAKRARLDVDEFAAALGLTLPREGDGGSGRVYEASPKHHAGAVQGRFISPAPTNGQRVLDASVQVKPESPRRVGVDKAAGEYVVFDETVAGVFHGHTRTWDQLHPDMQQALVDDGACARNGKIL